VVKNVQSAKSGEVREIARDSASTLPVRAEHLAVIKNALVGVNREGTSARAFAGAEYPSAGKTGTSQVFSLKGEKYSEHKIDERLRDHAWFIAYAPADKPKIAVAVLVENGGFGARAAAPIARKVFDSYLLGDRSGGPAPVMQTGAGDDESD
jgi:penicillin-binding protein 2